MKLVKGSIWAREFFEEGSRPSKAEMVEMLDNEDLPGRVIGGKPYIDVNRWMASGVRYTPTPEQKPSGALLLQ